MVKRIILGWLVGVGLTGAAFGAADFGNVPWVVIDHRAAVSGAYIGSPSIVIMPDGKYVASHDLFGPGTPNDQTVVFISGDRGKSWKQECEITGQFWSTMFVHHDALYILGVDKGMGRIVIRKSEDDGKTWTTPTDAKTGLITAKGKYHCAPVPVLGYGGRVWRGFEQGSHSKAVPDFPAFLISAPDDSDLLDASNWKRTESAMPDKDWLDGHFQGWEEGNAVANPEGKVVDILRVNLPSGGETAAMVHFDDQYQKPMFDPEKDFIHMPGGDVRFTIRFDPKSHLYWSLSNYLPASEGKDDPGSRRNTLALVCSKELRNWQVRCVLLHHPDHLHHAFQYLDWQFDGKDIVAVSRTAYDDGMGGAHTFHDANFLTFHRVENFRKLTGADSVNTLPGK